MINAGIDDGDVVLVKSEKEFISDDKPPFVYLKPENPKYELIPATENMRLKGKVISILKNGYWKSI